MLLRWARSAAPESRGYSSRETAYLHWRVQTADPGRSGCRQRVRRDRGRASTPWPVFFASDEVASGTQVRNAGRVGCAEARAEVEGQSTDRGESETAARQRAADGSAAQGGNRDRRSKKSGYAAGPSDRRDGGVVRAAIGDLAPTVGVRAACEAFDFPRASFYRKRGLGVLSPAAVAVRQVPRALVSAERETVLACLHEERFQNSAPLRFTLRCSTKAGIIARFAPCTGFSKVRARRVSAATNSCTRLTRSLNCWPLAPTSFGAGISRNCSVPRSGHTSIST